ncbi:Trp biosynthesis-associated membrane protein [Actinokineospora auranticolor]|uniref:Putative membrane protein (TIGR02234 family) n=1 Tax=Actinokineospora auranticolor TaxID=155976 RepID=A0A2S6GQW1_9PSEU|nr:Trp biosynthesis-associated membrane protein [Actinokineospora auranticolor]PPK67622.1 putative membrane protein (TIGR02234 family) [Actinokineospora auranticolor]
MTESRRPLWTAVGLLPLAAAALWGASRLPWGATIRSRPGTDATTSVPVPGAEIAPALLPLAVLALAAVAGLLAVAGPWRRVVGALLAAAGLVPVWTGLVQHTDADALWGRVLAAAGGALMVAAAVVLLLRGHRAPRLGSRYRSPAAVKEAARAEPDLWQALSAGDDPTESAEGR